MDLIIQIKSLLFSLGFGIVLSFVLDTFENFIYNRKLAIKLISSFLISILLSLTYFIINVELNDGRIHTYFIGVAIIGYYIDYKYIKLNKKIRKICKNIKIKKK